MGIFRRKEIVFLLLMTTVFLESCYRNNIQFGDNPENNYTRISFIDSVGPVLSTVLRDSFVTGNAQSFLLGRYKDPYLGIITAKPYFQLAIPATQTDIPVTAKFDSLVFLLRLNKYYYADTSHVQTIHINELDQTIDYTYSTNLYNTSYFAVKPVELGSRTMGIRPNADTVITVRLNDAKGMEIFNKLYIASPDVTTEDGFLSYFKGVSLSFTNTDQTAIYGLDGGAGQQIMRVYYHTTVPDLENKSIDFVSANNTFAFNQILTDRTGTTLYSSTGQREFPSALTNNQAFTQYGAGVLLKMTFPTLKSIVRTNDIVRLKKAELIIRPIAHSFDPFTYKLPPTLILAQTDGTNTVGAQVLDSTGALEQKTPTIDDIYNLNTNYRFDVTGAINQILTNSGTDDQGFFLLQNITQNAPTIDRAVIGNAVNATYKTQLLLTVIIIDQ